MIKKYWLAAGLVLVFAAQLNAQTLNFYFGNIHAHSGYSDGNKDSLTSGMSTPIEDFLYARQSQNIDFYGISEHNHFSAGMQNTAHYHQGLADADSATINGDFVAMYGMEWGVISNGGHAIVYGSNELLGWDNGFYDEFVSEYDYTSLWKKVNERPNAFAYLAHPATADYSGLFQNPATLVADNAIVGMAARSGPAFSTNFTYSDPTTSNYINRYNDALKRGYHVGVGLDHDTHNSVFGRQTAGRLVVLAPALTRDDILKAFRKMRFYSSDDWNTKVTFSVNNQIMGSTVTQAGSPTITVNVQDDDNENVSSIAVYYGIPGSGSAPTVLTTVNNNANLNYTHAIGNTAIYYYYLKITQQDGDIIWTSPIWYNRNDAINATPPVAAFAPSALSVCVGQPVTFTDNSTNGPAEWQWSLTGALPPVSDNQNTIATYYNPGTYSVSLIATNSYGADTSITQTITVKPLPDVTLTASSTLICLGETATLVATGADSYSWTTGATNDTIIVSPTSTIFYTVIGTTNGCTDNASVNLGVEQCSDVAETAAKPINLYPNPANEFITVDVGNITDKITIEVFDILGKILYSETTFNNLTTINLSQFSSGSYFVKVSSNSSIYVTKQFIVRKD
ncbi:MAG: CehA/McbA family metallohydrolase [Sphingobacteriales bacterium JAD_PAG50586_3]|nr:MAG: CehA/McbA family metallohydrolase [Sphingobacteriales bacterium JAD_PAG50586_3]